MYHGSSWVDNSDSLLDQIYNNLNEISQFYFVSLSINMAQVYNVNLKENSYDSMIMYLKGVKYKHNEFINKEDIVELEEQITKYLNYIEGFNFGEIEIRSSKVYSDQSLGMVEKPIYSYIK